MSGNIITVREHFRARPGEGQKRKKKRRYKKQRKKPGTLSYL